MKVTNYDLIKKIVEKTTDYCINGNQTLKNDEIREYILLCVEEEETIGYLSIKKKSQLVETIYNSINGLGPLQPLIDDDAITEIMINSEKEIFVEKNGQISKIDFQFESAESLRDLIQMIVSKVNRRVNESKPMVDARLEDGSRVSILLPPIALKGPTMTIRKFPKKAMTMEKLIEYKSLNRETAEILRKLVESKFNIFISGGTSSGKTSFLNALSNFIPKKERVITIEDSAELQLVTIENLVKLETREGNTEGKGEITMRDLIKSSLRMRPDRIIIGEVRGGEALEMLQAMNTGHDGSISTGHGNSIKDMLSRLETMVLTGTEMPMQAIKQQIASAIDIVIHLGRLRDQSRRVLAISEIVGLKNHEYITNPLFTFIEENDSTKDNLIGALVPSGNALKNIDKLKLSAVDLRIGETIDF
ncbi:MAG TPA: CpaF family protein [Clostridia bacterium]|nr:CpaF family protein [Clostridia bacterium]